MQFQITGDEKGTPKFHGELKRINVILGTNGSGKSKLLTAIELAAKLKQESDLKVVRVTAARREELPTSFSTRTTEGKKFDDFDEEVKDELEFFEKTPEQLQQEIETMEATQSAYRMRQALSHFSKSLAGERVE